MLPNQDTEYTVLKSLGDAYLQVAQGQRDAVAADDQDRWSEEEVSEGLTGARQERAREMQDSEIKKGGGKRTDKDRDTAFRLGTGTGPGRVGDPKPKQSAQGQGNAAKRRMKESYRGMTIGEILSENSEGV